MRRNHEGAQCQQWKVFEDEDQKDLDHLVVNRGSGGAPLFQDQKVRDHQNHHCGHHNVEALRQHRDHHQHHRGGDLWTQWQDQKVRDQDHHHGGALSALWPPWQDRKVRDHHHHSGHHNSHNGEALWQDRDHHNGGALWPGRLARPLGKTEKVGVADSRSDGDGGALWRRDGGTRKIEITITTITTTTETETRSPTRR